MNSSILRAKLSRSYLLSSHTIIYLGKAYLDKTQNPSGVENVPAGVGRIRGVTSKRTRLLLFCLNFYNLVSEKQMRAGAARSYNSIPVYFTPAQFPTLLVPQFTFDHAPIQITNQSNQNPHVGSIKISIK